jgi:hypothetical protein
MSSYHGETDSKKVSRAVVWWQHQRRLGPKWFLTPHVFLSSRVAGDARTLRLMGVTDPNIWAVEKDGDEYRALLLEQDPTFRVETDPIEQILEKYARSERIKSVYLDYCGNIETTLNGKSTRRVLAQLSDDSVVSVTLSLAREIHPLEEDRENLLLRGLRKFTPHKVTLLQSVHYKSGGHLPMETWTFALGQVPSRSKMRFDLKPNTAAVLSALAKSPETIRAMWEEEMMRAERRSLGAAKANKSRR